MEAYADHPESTHVIRLKGSDAQGVWKYAISCDSPNNEGLTY